MRRLFRLLALVGCAFIALPALAANEAVPWPAGQPTPDFTLTDSTGREWRLADARGKVVIVNFWATWCEPCLAEMPSLQQLAQQQGAKLLVLAVNFKERDAKVLNYARTAALALPLPIDRDGAVTASYAVKIFPSSILIGRDGRATLRVTGEVDWMGREAAAWLQPLLK